MIETATEQEKEIRRVCRWAFGGLYWFPGCNTKYADVRKPSKHNGAFCPFCGGEIEEVK